MFSVLQSFLVWYRAVNGCIVVHSTLLSNTRQCTNGYYWAVDSCIMFHSRLPFVLSSRWSNQGFQHAALGFWTLHWCPALHSSLVPYINIRLVYFKLIKSTKLIQRVVLTCGLQCCFYCAVYIGLAEHRWSSSTVNGCFVMCKTWLSYVVL